MATAVVATLAASAVAVMVQGVVMGAEQDARRGQADPATPYTAGMIGGEVSGGVLVTEVAYLASGRWAAVRAGLVMLYARGLLEAGRRGRIGRVGSSPRTGEPLERALFASLLGWSGAREVGQKPRVLVTQRELRRGLERRGLVRRWWVRALVPPGLAVLPGVLVARLVSLDVIVPQVGVLGVVACAAGAVWFLPRRTVAGARLLRRLRVDHADLVAEIESGRARLGAWAPERVGVVVALYGDAAVVAIMPAVARGAGLVDGGRWTRFIRHNSDRYGPWTAEAMSEIDRENPTTPF
ncbi:TIGR04222 domain-containing membrane protein [Micromonospora sp. CPCC 205371]|nr:TIGR04222 domain-containing membrane protein [Micromonospora sp. CPCC 205371]